MHKDKITAVERDAGVQILEILESFQILSIRGKKKIHMAQQYKASSL